MEKKEKTGKLKDHFVWVKDTDGNEFVCPIHALKDPDKLTEEEKAKCVNRSISSFIPDSKNMTIGNQAISIIESYRQNEPFPNEKMPHNHKCTFSKGESVAQS